jgi:hypothetical protein
MLKTVMVHVSYFLPALVRTYNEGLSFALLLLLLFLFLFLQTHYPEFCILDQFHHGFSILHHCMQPCPAALPGRNITSFITGRRPACSIAYFYRSKAGSLVLKGFPAIYKTLRFSALCTKAEMLHIP